MKKKLAWHYTTGPLFVKIAACNELRPATTNVPNHERPILWFSFNQVWEETANKGITIKGVNKTLTRQEMIESGVGLVRFGIVVTKHRDCYRSELGERLFGWPKLAGKAKMYRETRKHLEWAAYDYNANPYDWIGMFSPIPLDQCNKIEFFNSEYKWVDFNEVYPATDVDGLEKGL
jgi:hypothetical protein